MTALNLTRLPDWPERLALTIERARAVSFAWGTADCVNFAAACVHAVTGADVLWPFRGGWSSALGAERILRRRGGLVPAVSSVLGPGQQGSALIQRGDVLLVGIERPWLAVCDGPRWWAPTRAGLVSGPAAAAGVFWPVGRVEVGNA